jgi:CHASE2 domain-containing sensor protein
MGVSKRDGVWFSLAGGLVWISGTLAYLNLTGGRMGAATWPHSLNIFLAAAALALFFPITARVRRTPNPERALAALAFSAPGLIASATVAVNAQVLLPQLAPAAIGRYVALALTAYALALAQAIDRPAKPA